MNPAGIENHLRLVLVDWAIIIAFAWIFGRLGKRLGQPLAVGEIVAGLILGPSVLGLIWPAHWPAVFPAETQQSLQLLGKLGLILLLFQVGMEFDFGHLRYQSKTVVGVSLLGILGPALAGIGIAPWLRSHFAPQTNLFGFQLYVCVALSITALPILGRILLEMNLERTALGTLAVSAAAVDDVIGWVGLAAITALVTSKFSFRVLFLQLAGTVLFILVLMLGVGPLLCRYWRRTCSAVEDGKRSIMPATFLAVLLITLFASCLATNRLGIFSIFGAFLFGVSLHRQTDLVRAWRTQMSNFVLVALVPIFFTNTGLRTEIGSLKTGLAWLGCALVLLGGAVGKIGGCWAACKIGGSTNREAWSIAALMNTRALMGLIAVNVGYELGLLPRELFTMFVIMSLATTAMTGPILRWTLPDELRPLTPQFAAERRAKRPPPTLTHAG